MVLSCHISPPAMPNPSPLRLTLNPTSLLRRWAWACHLHHVTYTNLGKRPDRWLRGSGHRVSSWERALLSHCPPTPTSWNSRAREGGVLVWVGLETPRNPVSTH